MLETLLAPLHYEYMLKAIFVSALIGGVDARNPETIALGLPLEIDYSAVDPERPGLVFKPR